MTYRLSSLRYDELLVEMCGNTHLRLGHNICSCSVVMDKTGNIIKSNRLIYSHFMFQLLPNKRWKEVTIHFSFPQCISVPVLCVLQFSYTQNIMLMICTEL